MRCQKNIAACLSSSIGTELGSPLKIKNKIGKCKTVKFNFTSLLHELASAFHKKQESFKG